MDRINQNEQELDKESIFYSIIDTKEINHTCVFSNWPPFTNFRMSLQPTKSDIEALEWTN